MYSNIREYIEKVGRVMTVWSKDVMAKNLKKYMDLYGKNQKEMAEIAGVATSTYNDWIKAKKYPRIDKIEILANYFGILKSDLIEDKEDIKKSIEENPIEYANEVAAILKNKDIMTLIRTYMSLSEEKQKQAQEFIKFLKGN